MAVQEHWPARNVPSALFVGSVPKEPCGPSQLCSGCSDLIPLLHPSTHRRLCARAVPHCAAASTFSGALVAADGVLCPARQAEPGSPRSDGHTKARQRRPFPGRGCTGPLCRSQEPGVCTGVGRGGIWLFTELLHPIEKAAICFQGPSRRQRVQGHAGAAAWHREGFHAALTLGRARGRAPRPSFHAKPPCPAQQPPRCQSGLAVGSALKSCPRTAQKLFLPLHHHPINTARSPPVQAVHE